VPLGSDIVERGALFTLNESATFVWNQLRRPVAVADIAAALTREFQVSARRAQADVRRLVRQLVSAGCARGVSSREAR